VCIFCSTFAHGASVTGLEESIPFCVVHLPGTCFCAGSAHGRRPMGFMRNRSANLRKTWSHRWMRRQTVWRP